MTDIENDFSRMAFLIFPKSTCFSKKSLAIAEPRGAGNDRPLKTGVPQAISTLT
ncbi:hypothetical protein [Bradyrhizobium betae]|uniref:hypothetical protein n=1 Tax=Bradyrhizobium betae TaxID=244734 RepID=UPI0012B692CF|nr:hypothetical protein [Bradyrhizobium betae]MCS3728327.1 hypothetical protein [Bradyrhizobium betae]